MRKLLIVVALCAVSVCAHVDEFASPEVRAFVRVYDDCHKADGSMVNCFKKKAITFLDRMTNIEAISLGEGVRIVRSANSAAVEADLPKLQTEADIERSLPRGLDNKDQALTSLLVERIARFFNTRSVTLNLPAVSGTEIARGVEEGKFNC